MCRSLACNSRKFVRNTSTTDLSHFTSKPICSPTHLLIHPPRLPLTSSFPAAPLNPRPPSSYTLLLRRRSIKDIIPRLRLPLPLLDAEDLRAGLPPLLRVLQQRGADDDLVAHDVLVVVGVRGAVGAVEAVYRVACDGEHTVNLGVWEVWDDREVVGGEEGEGA
jgi:hypothetical protein